MAFCWNSAIPRDMILTQRSRAARWGGRKPRVMRMTRAVLATRSRSLSLVEEESRAPSSAAKGSASARPQTISTKRSEKACFCGTGRDGSSSMVSVIRHRR